MTVEAPVLTVIVVTYQSRAHLPACLRALPAAARELPYEVVAVDNASSDGTVALLRQEFPEVRCLENTVNRGFAAAVNQGAREGRGSGLLLLNPDAVPAPDSLAVLWAVLEASPGAGLVGPQLVNPDGSLQPSAWRAPGLVTAALEALLINDVVPRSPWSFERVDHAQEVECLSGACLLVRRKCFEALGGLDEGFFLYHEDFDLCLRARAGGWGVRIVPEACVSHLLGGSAFQDRRTFAVRFHRSRQRFFRKHAGPVPAALHLGGLLLRRTLYPVAGAFSPAWRTKSQDVGAILRALKDSR